MLNLEIHSLFIWVFVIIFIIIHFMKIERGAAMKFWKYHGLGNDFVIVDNMDGKLSLDRQEAEILCHRHFGIGADGLMLSEKSARADVKMIIYNSDGSRPAMCGNGVRCFAKFVYDRGIVKKDVIAVETDAGIMNIEMKVEEGKAKAAVVNMGKPDFLASKVPIIHEQDQVINQEVEIEGTKYKITSMLMGVPHTVVFVDTLEDEQVILIGKQIEKASLFPHKTNVNFVKVIDEENIILRTWERGAGYTYACGTGACASVAAGVVGGLTKEKVKVQLRGGDLIVQWRDRGDIYMEGPAVEVFEGIYTNS